MTKSGNAIGTFQYIAPERLGTRAEEDARADIYSLACVLDECLTGRPPFAGDTMAGLVAAHLNTPPPQPSATQPNVPAQFDPVIATGMAKDPDQRYATTVELANAAHDAIFTPPAPPSEPTLLADAPPATPTSAAATRPDPNRARAAAGVATRRRPETWPRPKNAHPAGPPVPPPRSADRPPPQIGTPPPLAGHRPRRWLKWPLIAAIVVILAAAGITGYLLWPNASRQIALVLPFTGLIGPDGVAVDAAGNLDVTDATNNRVVKLAAGSSTQSVLPFTGLIGPTGVAVDAAGNLDVTDATNNRVVKLAAGSGTQSVLPFTGLIGPTGVAVDGAGSVYVTSLDFACGALEGV